MSECNNIWPVHPLSDSQLETMRRLVAAGPGLIEVCMAMAELMESPWDWKGELFEARVPVEAIRKSHESLELLRGVEAGDVVNLRR